MKPKAALRHLLSLAGSSMLAISSAPALTYYWDNNGTGTTGFGTAGGTWADTGSSLWSGSSTGGADATLGTNVITTTSDSLNFGTGTTGNGLGAGTITVSGTVNAGSITFGSQSGTITLSGGTINLASTTTISANGTMTIDSLITGAGTSLTKAAGGTLRLTNTANTYTGATLIGQSTGGALEATFLANGGVASSIGASSNAASNLVLSNINAGVLRYIGTTNASSDRLFTLGNQQGYAGGFEVTGTGSLNLTNTGSVAFSQANSARIFSLGGTHIGQNILSALLVDNGTGTLSFIKNGVGNWVLANNSNSYTGTTTLNGGTLSVSKMADYNTDSAIGKGTAGAAIVFNGGALNYIGSGDDTDRLIQLTNNGTILNNGEGALNFDAIGNFNVQASTTNARTLTLGGTNGGTISGAIRNNNTGTISVTKIGTGTWTLGGTNTYSGTTSVNGGILELKDTGTGRTQTNGALTFGLGDGTLTSNRAGSGTLSTTFTTLTRTAGATGNFISTGGTNGSDIIVNTTGAAGYMGKGLFYNNSEIAWREGTNGYVRGINYGVDSGTSAVNTVTTNTHMKFTSSVSRSGALELSSLHLAGSGVNWTNSTGVSNINGSLIKSGGGTSIISGTGTVGVNSNAELVINTVASNDTLEISSQMVTFNAGLTKAGAGTLVLSNAGNTFNSQIFVNSGTLSIGANGNLGSQAGAQTVHLRGGTLQATGTFGLFNGTAGTNNRAVTLLNQSTIEVTGSNTLTIAGAISNNTSAGVTTPGFNKTGTGNLVLSGTNTYTGATNVTGGTLVVNGSIATSSLTTVASGATIGGSGTTGALTVSTGGFINPGNSPGILNTGDYTQAGLFTAEITGLTPGTQHDQINVTGSVDITGGSLSALFTAGTYAANDLIFILLNDGSDAITGTYASLAQGDTVTTYGGFNWNISYLGDSVGNTFTGGNDIVLQAVVIPEPATALLGCLGLLFLLRRRR